MKKCMIGVMAWCFFMTPVICRADETSQGERVTVLEDVVVTATKTTEKREDVPNSVIIIDKTDIKDSPAGSLGELLANELGIDWRTYGNYGGASGAIEIRGMDASGTQVMINGVSINSPSLGSANVSGIPLSSIEKIEIVKGAGSVLYGSSSMAGTINIITKRPERGKVDAKVSAGAGTENSTLLSVEQGMFAWKDVGYYVTANRYETDGFRDNGDLLQQDASANIVFEKTDALDISLYADLIKRKYGIPGVQPPEGTDDYYVNGEMMYNDEAASLVDHHTDDDLHLAFNLKSKPVDRLTFNFRTDYMNMESYDYMRSNYSGEGEETWIDNKSRGAEANADIDIFSGASLIVGGEYREFDYKNTTGGLDPAGDPDGGKTSESHTVLTRGVFSEAQYRPIRYIKFLAGIRQENHSMFGEENVPRYGIVVNPMENTVIKFSHGKHFAAPTMNDLYWPDGDYTRGNPDLKPETGWHTDMTVEQNLFKDRLFLECSFFTWDVEDKISWAENPEYLAPYGYKWTPSNVDKYNATGFELGGKMKLNDDITLGLNYTYMNAYEERKDSVKRRAVNTPEDLFKGSLTYVAGFGLTVSTTARYVGDRPAFYENATDTKPQYRMDSYWTCDMKIEQRLGGNWALALQGNNLFDEDYVTNMAGFTDVTTVETTREGYPGAGRSVFFNVAYEY